MNVTKRNNNIQQFEEKKIIKQIRILEKTGSTQINVSDDDIQRICTKIKDGFVQNMNTYQLNETIASICQDLCLVNPQLCVLGGRLLVQNLHSEKHVGQFCPVKHTTQDKLDFVKVIEFMYNEGYIDQKYNTIVQNNKEQFMKEINYNLDYDTDFFAFKTFEKQYSIKIKDKILESQQDTFMRIALQIHEYDLPLVFQTYHSLSKKLYIHSSPTIFNSLIKNRNQLSSCYLVYMQEDSLEGIFSTLNDVSEISKYGAGISLQTSNIRAKSSKIGFRDNSSSSITKMLKVFDSTIRYVNQQNIRNGSMAVYLDIHHPDILDFLQMRVNSGDPENKCLYLFSAVWISDLFMKRVENDELFSLLCPYATNHVLEELYGEQFEQKYIELEQQLQSQLQSIESQLEIASTKQLREQRDKLKQQQIPARLLWQNLMRAIIESNIYVLYKDTINIKSNQKNIGTIKQSNLCCEIVQYTDKDNIAVCSLGSLILPTFVNKEFFDFELLHKASQELTVNMNKVLDNTFYPVQKAKTCAQDQRAIGVGQIGLQDVFFMLDIPYDSDKAKQLSTRIAETIYHGCLTASVELSKKQGPYKYFKNSDFSKGILQFDYTNHTPQHYDFQSLKQDIIKYGIRNSLLTSIQPTASVSQLSQAYEACEPHQSNLYNRNTISGTFVVVNKYLVEKLKSLNLWNQKTIDLLINSEGSVQNMDIPQNIKDVYKTAFEIKQKKIIDMYAERQQFVDQSQSMNLFFDVPDVDKLTSSLMYGHHQGLKTGLYYLRQKPVVDQIKFQYENKNEPQKKIDCDENVCTMCQ